jgi:hypothetical protein
MSSLGLRRREQNKVDSPQITLAEILAFIWSLLKGFAALVLAFSLLIIYGYLTNY